MPGDARLVVTAGRAAGTVIELGEELIVGREADGDGRLAEDPAISRRHARIARRADGGLLIEDLGSTNGTWVNGRRVAAQPLAPGDVLQIGDSTLELAAPGDSEQATVAPAPRERVRASGAPVLAGMALEQLRAELPALAGGVQLDAAGGGPAPRAALEAARAALAEAETGRARSADRREQVRGQLAELLGAAPVRVALAPSVAAAAAAFIATVRLRRFDEVLVSDEEPPELLAPVEAARELLAVSVRAAPLERIAEEVGPRTRLVVCSHVSHATGRVADADALAALEVPVLLDATRTAGCMPLSPGVLGCTAVALGVHAWLCGPRGLAALRVGEDSARAGAPPPDEGEREDAVLAWAVAALELLDRAGHAWLAHEAPRRAGALAGLLAERGLDPEPRGDSAIVAWREPDPAARVARLAARGISAAALPTLGLVRASPGAWTADEELERAASEAAA